jgi:hypothetical protein
MQWLDYIPWTMLIFMALFLGMAPFVPEPHLLAKLRMLSQGELTRSIDIFDLIWHVFPLVLLVMKAFRRNTIHDEHR